MHYHYDVVDRLPPGAVLLLSSHGYPHQAWRHGRAAWAPAVPHRADRGGGAGVGPQPRDAWNRWAGSGRAARRGRGGDGRSGGTSRTGSSPSRPIRRPARGTAADGGRDEPAGSADRRPATACPTPTGCSEDLAMAGLWGADGPIAANEDVLAAISRTGRPELAVNGLARLLRGRPAIRRRSWTALRTEPRFRGRLLGGARRVHRAVRAPGAPGRRTGTACCPRRRRRGAGAGRRDAPGAVRRARASTRTRRRAPAPTGARADRHRRQGDQRPAPRPTGRSC